MSKKSDINWTTVYTKDNKTGKAIQFGVSSEQDHVILSYLADEYPLPTETVSGLDGPFFVFDHTADAWVLKTAVDDQMFFIRPEEGQWLIHDDELGRETVVSKEMYSELWTEGQLEEGEKGEDVHPLKDGTEGQLEKGEEGEKGEDVHPLKDGTVVGSFRPGNFVVETQETPDSEWLPIGRFHTKKSAMERASIMTEMDMVPSRVVYKEFVHEDVIPEWWGE